MTYTKDNTIAVTDDPAVKTSELLADAKKLFPYYCYNEDEINTELPAPKTKTTRYFPDTPDPALLNISYYDAEAQGILQECMTAREYLIFSIEYFKKHEILPDVKGWTRTSSLWRGGGLVSGGAGVGGSWLRLGYGGRGDRNPGCGLRQAVFLSSSTKRIIKTLTKVKLNTQAPSRFISDANDVFTGYIDSDFKNWNCNYGDGGEIRNTDFDVKELTEDMTINQMFNTETDVMSQSEIVAFCEGCKSQLRTDGYSTLFLFKNKDEYFVASVRFDGAGRLGVDVRRLSRGRVWGADRRHRVVFPATTSTLNTSNSQSLELLDTSLESTLISILNESIGSNTSAEVRFIIKQKLLEL